MDFRWGLTLIMALCLASPAGAEFYKYRDKHGAIRFTDNLADVPAEQREQLKVYEGSTRPVAQELPPAAAQEAEAPRGSVPDAAEVPADQAAAEALIAELRQRQQTLMEEYAALQKEREALAAVAGQRVSGAEQKRYNQQVEDLNARLADYQKRRDAFERQVTAHNEKMKRRLAPNAEGSPPS